MITAGSSGRSRNIRLHFRQRSTIVLGVIVSAALSSCSFPEHRNWGGPAAAGVMDARYWEGSLETTYARGSLNFETRIEDCTLGSPTGGVSAVEKTRRIAFLKKINKVRPRPQRFKTIIQFFDENSEATESFDATFVSEKHFDFGDMKIPCMYIARGQVQRAKPLSPLSYYWSFKPLNRSEQDGETAKSGEGDKK